MEVAGTEKSQARCGRRLPGAQGSWHGDGEATTMEALAAGERPETWRSGSPAREEKGDGRGIQGLGTATLLWSGTVWLADDEEETGRGHGAESVRACGAAGGEERGDGDRARERDGGVRERRRERSSRERDVIEGARSLAARVTAEVALGPAQ